MKTLAVGLPGSVFSGAWVANWTSLFSHLQALYTVVPIFGYSSNVYLTRACIADCLSRQARRPDRVLWMDDDNILAGEQFDRLDSVLSDHPDCDGLAGWSWCTADVYASKAKVSAGSFDSDGVPVPLPYPDLVSGPELRPVEWTGFPAFLMPYETLVKAGPRPFAPVLVGAHPWGFLGEDTAFCATARARFGARFLVDRSVKVPHLKLRAAEPIGADVEVLELSAVELEHVA